MQPHFIFTQRPAKTTPILFHFISQFRNRAKQAQWPSQRRVRASQTHLHRTRTCTLTPLSLSYLLWLLEFESADRRSRAGLSLERGVCDGDNGIIPPPPLLCCASIAVPPSKSVRRIAISETLLPASFHRVRFPVRSARRKS